MNASCRPVTGGRLPRAGLALFSMSHFGASGLLPEPTFLPFPDPKPPC
jgi:hypothetical protein